MIYHPGDTITISDWAYVAPPNTSFQARLTITDVQQIYGCVYTDTGGFGTGPLAYSNNTGKTVADWHPVILSGTLGQPGLVVQVTVPTVMSAKQLRDRFTFANGTAFTTTERATLDVDSISTGDKYFCCAMGANGKALYAAVSDGHDTTIYAYGSTLSSREARGTVAGLFEPALHIDSRNVFWLAGVAVDGTSFDGVRHRLLRSNDGGFTWDEQTHPYPLPNLLVGAPGILNGYRPSANSHEVNPALWSTPGGVLYLFSFASSLPSGVSRSNDSPRGFYRNAEEGRDGKWEQVPAALLNWSTQDMAAIQGRASLMDNGWLLGATVSTSTGSLQMVPPAVAGTRHPLTIPWNPDTTGATRGFTTPVAGEPQIWRDRATSQLHLWGSTKSYRNFWPLLPDGLTRWYTSEDGGFHWTNRSA